MFPMINYDAIPRSERFIINPTFSKVENKELILNFFQKS